MKDSIRDYITGIMTNKTFHRKAHKTETPEQGFPAWENRKRKFKESGHIKNWQIQTETNYKSKKE